jgi:tetratricopeptide (TPR) repeat protein
MLTLGAYLRYVRQPSRAAFLVVGVVYAAALMSKAMVVTLPLILLVLDWWPLNRFRNLGAMKSLIIEKWPLFALALLSAIIAALSQHRANAVESLQSIPAGTRVANSLVSGAWYVVKLFWPSNLAVFYPYPLSGLPAGEVLGAAALLVGISVMAICFRRRQPWLLAGWLWFAVMVLPVIGLVQLGSQARADRYSYLPQIGLAIALAWLLGSLAASVPRWRTVIAGAAVLAIGALSAGAYVQVLNWQDSERLWVHTLACTKDNWLAHYDYGTVLAAKKDTKGALAEFQKAVDLQPNYADALNNVGSLLVDQGRAAEAIGYLKKAVMVNPGFAVAHNNLGRAQVHEGLQPEAAEQFREALEGNPNFFAAHLDFANLLLSENVLDKAAEHYQAALRIRPDSPEARSGLNRIAWTLATSPRAKERNGAAAVQLAQQLVKLSGGNDPVYLTTLAAAQAESGRFDDAATNATIALNLVKNEGDTAINALLAAQIKLYLQHTPYHERAPVQAP